MKPTVTLATTRTPDGATMTLHEHDGQHFLKVAGLQLMSTTASSSEEQMAELSCATLPPRPRILIGGLGFGFTLKRVLELTGPDAAVHVSELMPEIVAWNREYLAAVNGRLLDDPRVTTLVRDVYDIIGKASGPDRYHAILLDVDNGPDPFVQKGNERLYQGSGLVRIKAALQPGGRVIFWSAHQDKSFVKTLSRTFRNVEAISAKAYPKAKRFTHTLFIADRD
ncbi:spermine synthase [Luteolibacter sp. SL250]|uniref:spermine synthase n=1 Tax=Luteolibacter sp. SL250 TaxID=2995170 RepID=UPI00226E8825|nr:spermine synthase [Luteolibacter sp. SL250]WAC19433.1 spermine synthase [Luteolibacter sp. SL250]